MKVLIIAHHLDLPEAHLCCSLQKIGIQIDILVESTSPFLDVLKVNNVNFSTIKLDARFSIGGILTLRKKIQEGRYDIIHTLSNRALTNALFATIGIDVKHVTYRGTIGHLSRWSILSKLSYLNSRVDKIICVSDAVKKYLLTLNIDERKLATIYKGHLSSWYKPGTLPSELRDKLPKDSKIISCTANMRRVKGVDILIKAMDFLEDRANIHLLLIGHYDSKNKLFLESRSKNNIHFTGFRKDAVGIVSNSDIFVMPSRSREGLPKALIEAMLAKIPCIASRVGGIPELIENQVTGILVNPENPQELAQSIEKLLADHNLSNKIKENAFLNIINNFNFEKTVSCTHKLYLGLLNNF